MNSCGFTTWKEDYWLQMGIKYNSDDSIEHHKACLIMLENRRVASIHFNETFALVAKMSSICVFLSDATIQD